MVKKTTIELTKNQLNFDPLLIKNCEVNISVDKIEIVFELEEEDKKEAG